MNKEGGRKYERTLNDPDFQPRVGDFLKPINEMSWDEELSELQLLYKGVEEGFEKQTPAFKKAFGSMFSSWEHRLRRYGAIEKHPDFLAETMVGMMEQTVNSYTLKDTRDSYKIHNGEIDGKIIYFGDFHDEYNIYTPRNMRMGIMRYGLDGYERVKPKYLAAREGLVTYDSNLFDFCFRLLNRAKGRLNNVRPELFS